MSKHSHPVKEKGKRTVKSDESVFTGQLTIGSHVSVRSSRYEASGKFGEHERCVRVALGHASSNFSFLSAL